MPDASSTRLASLGQRLALFVASLSLLACPVREDSPPDDPKDSSLDASHDALHDADEADSGDPADATDDAADSTRADASPSARVDARLTPIDLDLGSTVLAPIDFTIDAGTSEITWPAGAWRLTLSVDGELLGVTSGRPTGLRRDAEPLSALDSVDDAAVLFNPCDEPVRVGVDLTARTLTIARSVDAPAPALDARPESCAGAGALFDDAIFAINTAEGDSFEQVTDLLDELRVRGLAPLETSRGTLFIAPGSSDEPAPQVRGDLNGWSASDTHTLRPLTRRLFARFVDLPEGRTAYKLVYGDGAAWFTDPSNPNIAWDGVEDAGVGDFNSVLDRRARGPRLVWVPGVYSPELDNRRDLYVLLPAAYDDDPARRFPTLYLHDGNESLSRSQLDSVTSDWIGADTTRALILVFAHLPTQDVRLAEYTFGTPDARGDDYASFFVETLVPTVDASFRTRARARSRGIAGASLGGLISYRIATQNPGVFEYTAGMSSSFWWEDRLMVAELRRLGCQNQTFYLDSGAPGDGVDGTRAMRDALVDLGCPHTHVEEPDASHDWFYWKRRFPGLLDAFHAVSSDAPTE